MDNFNCETAGGSPDQAERIAAIGGLRAQETAKTIDGYIRAVLKPKPTWMPFKIYQFLINKLFVLEHFISNEK